ncbi:MAG: GNAT family N-acetyltransferase [Bacillota bacterium]
MAVVQVTTQAQVKRFIDLEAAVYRNNPYWVPAIAKDTSRLITGRTPFSSYIEQNAFYAEHEGEVTARVCMFINRLFIKNRKRNTAFFGLFEALPDKQIDVVELFRAAVSWLKEKGVSSLTGPVNGDLFFGFGLKSDRFDELPVFPYSYAQPYYAAYLESMGFNKQHRELCYSIDLESIPEAHLLSRYEIPGVDIRPVSLTDFQRDHAAIIGIGNAAFKNIWYFAGYDVDTSYEFWMEKKPFIVPDFVLIAEAGGRPIGYIISFLDLNAAVQAMGGRNDLFAALKFLWTRRGIRDGSVFSMGVLPAYAGKGVGSALLAAILLTMKKRGFTKCYYHTVTDNNIPSRKLAESFNGSVTANYAGYYKKV